jgi:two-component system, NtrC family, response regulator AtoC
MSTMENRRRSVPRAGAPRTTVRHLTPAFAPPGGRLHLLVIGDDLYATHPLPEAGAVAIGRSPACEVFVDHPSVSRRHAVLHLGPPLAIEDQGSSNGTRVREVQLAPNQRVVFAPGDLIEVGALQLVVQQRSAPVRGRRVWAHDYFDARLEEECERCEVSGAGFVTLHLRADPQRASDVEDVLAQELRTVDVVAMYAPGQYEALMCESNVADGSEVVGRLTAALTARGVAPQIGMASYPDDGRNPHSIIARAAERARGEEHHAPAVAVASPETGMQTLWRLVERIAHANISVLIQGETGVGKEMMTETIHNMSPRAAQPFLRLNCAALSQTLLESELFGYEKGAFTGAVSAKPGLLETADKGTVFLDEIGELPPSIQAKLLRVLEERRVLRVGGLKSKAIDVRFVAATNRDLEAEVARGTFRQDLFFRLNGIALTIPPLRERQTEIRPLAEIFIARACAESGRTPLPLSPEASALLHRYSWPGNIRELKHMMERAVLLCQGDAIAPEHLPLEKMRATRPAQPARSPVEPTADSPREHRHPAIAARRPTPPTPAQEESLDFKKDSRERERKQIIAALKSAEGNQSKAAKILGISRRTLLTKLDVHKLPRPRKRS